MDKIKIYFLLVLFFSSIIGLAQETGKLIIEVGSLRNNDGYVALAIHDKDDGFPGGTKSAIARDTAFISNGKANFEFNNLPFGIYAVSAFHDENANKEMDTNWLGIPKEGVGASNDARSRFGPPKYEEAKFEFFENGQKIKFNIQYLF